MNSKRAQACHPVLLPPPREVLKAGGQLTKVKHHHSRQAMPLLRIPRCNGCIAAGRHREAMSGSPQLTLALCSPHSTATSCPGILASTVDEVKHRQCMPQCVLLENEAQAVEVGCSQHTR